MRACSNLEAVFVAPKGHDSWIEYVTMQQARGRFIHILEEAGVSHRAYFCHPQAGEGEAATDVKIHSKLMIVDDALLRVGSTNLANRSMGLDSECDLLFAATDPYGRRSAGFAVNCSDIIVA